ncbi:MAG: UDP-N-acetylmuramoyl-tripeptide--D-alanyl-D-alanine ligase [Bombilactobacillus mellifer]|nr:UDP-N-acetylmuramoyl-tripeptide--D-alanyl-D-alanine ligase [Bombilactobacillus mellifer]
MKISLKQIKRLFDDQDVTSSIDDVVIDHIDFDSRQVTPGALFVPLIGERDGHDFINMAAEKGANATLVLNDHETSKLTIPYIKVDDINEAIFKIANFCLRKINPKVVVITGSNGKTTTKDLAYSVLSQKYRVWRTKDNFNNEIGVPYTLISMPENTQILTIEVGIDNFNQMKRYSTLLRPDIAIITMIGEAHLEFFKTRKAIAQEKLKIASNLKSNGTLLINGDEPLLTENAKFLNCMTKTFGASNKNDIYPITIKTDLRKSEYQTNLTDNTVFTLNLIGKYNLINSLPVILAAKILNLTNTEIKLGLKNLSLTKDRSAWLTGKKGEQILDDAYNSNPTAVKKVLMAFENIKLPSNAKKVLVLGDMLELGKESRQMHANLANFLPINTFDYIYLYGNEIKELYFKLKPIYKEKVQYYPILQYQHLVRAVDQVMDKNSYLLVKASHGLHLERLVNFLTTKN